MSSRAVLIQCVRFVRLIHSYDKVFVDDDDDGVEGIRAMMIFNSTS
jgi:hypothetical protein